MIADIPAGLFCIQATHVYDAPVVHISSVSNSDKQLLLTFSINVFFRMLCKHLKNDELQRGGNSPFFPVC